MKACKASEQIGIWKVIEGSGTQTQAAVESLEYRFLAEHGYPEILQMGYSGVSKDIVRKKMRKRGEKLHICRRYDGDTGVYRIFYSLRRGKRVIATSKSIDLQFKPLEDPEDAQG